MNPLFNEGSIELPNRVTSTELDKLGKVLKIEIVIGLLVTLSFFILRNRIDELAFLMSIIIAVCGLTFSIYGYYLSRKIKVEDNSIQFLKNTISMLKHFVVKYLIFIQIILIIIYLFLGFASTSTTFIDWVTSKSGIKTSLLILIVDIICLTYGYFFYIKRYLRMKKALKGF